MQKWILKASRIEAIADGIFAVAMTILILNINLPQNLTMSALWLNLEHSVLYNLFIFMGSFIILGTFWVGMSFQYGFLVHVTRPYLWINIILLMLVCVVPFSASLLAKFPHSSVSITFYAINLCLGSLMELISWWYAQSFNLNVKTANIMEVNRSVYRRITIALVFYALALMLARWNTSLAFVMLILPPLVHIIPGAVDKYPEKIT